jgi:hypothetical protein
MAEKNDPRAPEFEALIEYLKRVPAIENWFGCGQFENGLWWVKFTIDIAHPLAWHTVQELGFVLNYLSINEPLPTCFKPVSPPPYLNGGPEFLSWVVESTRSDFSPDLAKEWLEGRLPNPVEDESQWQD